MPDEVGSMSVAYTIVVNQALKSLNSLKAGITDVIKKTQEWNESGDRQESKLKSIGKAWALVGAVSTAALYGIMKASSYAAIYSKQFGAQIQRVANLLMEKTGLTAAVEGALEVLDRFIDRMEEGGNIFDIIITTLIDLKKWWDELSTMSKLIIVIMGVVTAVGLLIAGIILFGVIASAFTAGLAAISSVLLSLGITIAALPLILATLAGAILGLIVVWLLWKTGVLEAFYNLGAKLGAWLVELGGKFGTWLVELGGKFATKISEILDKWRHFKTGVGIVFDNIWTYIIEGLTDMKDDFFGIISTIITKVSDLIKKILSIPPIKIPSWLGGGGGGGGSFDTSISSGSMMGGGDSHQFGGPIKETGLNLLHGGEYVIPKAGKLISSGGGGNTYNISTTVNVAPGTSSNMASEISRQVSKAIASEVKRITKV